MAVGGDGEIHREDMESAFNTGVYDEFDINGWMIFCDLIGWLISEPTGIWSERCWKKRFNLNMITQLDRNYIIG